MNCNRPTPLFTAYDFAIVIDFVALLALINQYRLNIRLVDYAHFFH